MTDAQALHLKKRHAAEGRFRLYGRVAIVVALSFLVLLLGRLGLQGYSTFTTNYTAPTTLGSFVTTVAPVTYNGSPWSCPPSRAPARTTS